MRNSQIVIISALILVLGVTGAGIGQDMSGEEVLLRVENAISATSARIHLRMELHSQGGSTRERSMQIFMKESNGQSRSLMKFTAPADVEGTAFLALEHQDEDEEMYLYMPVLGSVRRIAGSQKNGSFVGTDFTYNDLTILGGGNYQEDYSAEVLSRDNDKYILKLIPSDDEIQYTYVKMWVPVDTWFPTKIEFFGEQDQKRKVLINEDFEEIDGNRTARKITMKDLENGSKTVLSLSEIQYNVEISDRIFTTRYLQRQ